MNIEGMIVGFFNNIGSFPFDMILKGLGISFIVFWIMVSGWVFLDARERAQSKGFQLLSFIFVLVFNIPGLFIYMLIRPKATIQEQYWGDLEKRYLLYETAELFDCPKCGYPLQPGFINCPNCAETVKVKCECGVNIDKYWKHCPYCGKANDQAKTFQNTVVNSGVAKEVANIVSSNQESNKKIVTEDKAATPAKKDEVRKANRISIGEGLNSVFKNTQVKLVQLKEKMAMKKTIVNSKQVVKDTIVVDTKKQGKAKKVK